MSEEFRTTLEKHSEALGKAMSVPCFKSELWNEDDDDVLWWKFPIEEAPYVGSPLDTDWPGYHTHFTYIKVPENPDEE